MRRAVFFLPLIAGLAAGFAHPPWGFLPGLLGYGLMFTRVDRAATFRSASLRGWLAGCGYFLVSLWWIYEPFQVDAQAQGWMAPFAVAIMAGGMALFWGAAAGVYHTLKGMSVWRLLLFVGLLAAAEWLRGHVLTGFPWNLPGETWRAGSAPSQAAALVGAYGLTWITLAVASAPWLAREGRPGKIAAATAVAGIALLFVFGAVRLGETPSPRQGAPMVRIVQANVDQKIKYDRRVFADIVRRYLTLTARPAARRPDVVIWPEGAIPAAIDDYLAPRTWTQDAIAQAMTPGQTLILGGYRYGGAHNGKEAIFNSFAVVRPSSAGLTVVGVYDKYRLVPFGEFMPLDSLAARLGIKQMVHVGDGFTPGPPPRPLRVAGLPVMQPLICYEGLFPGFTRAGARAAGARPDWIVNISNDAWFGAGSGPLQHLNIAGYRAIEEGLPMVRATPTGVSAMIDAFGRIVPGKMLGEGAFGVIDASLPPALPPTLYDRWGDWPFAAMLFVSLAGTRRPLRHGARKRAAPPPP